jgi:hypothetical protein
MRYRTTYKAWPAFTVTGISRIVASGGEVYNAVRRDGRWEALRRLGGEDATLYGVASFDKACSQGTCRYTLGVKGALATAGDLLAGETLFSLPIRQAGWLVFELDDFSGAYRGARLRRSEKWQSMRGTLSYRTYRRSIPANTPTSSSRL